VDSPAFTDLAGNTAAAGAASHSFMIDKVAPDIAFNSRTPAANANGWNNTNVTVKWDCSDGLSGVVSPTVMDVKSAELAGQIANGTCTDKASNSATANLNGINVDKTAPASIAVSGILAKTYAISDLPASSAISCTADGAISGLAGCIVTGYGADFGQHTLTAIATDNAGNQSTSSLTYIVGLQSGDVLPPLTAPNKDQANPAATDLQVFKIKSVLPVKFQLFLDAGKTKLMTTPPAGSVARITFGKYDSTTDSVDPVAELISAGAANTDNLYRWTGSPDYQYIYNLSTTGKAAGTYGVTLTLFAADGTILAKSATQYFVLRS
jgi:hypothetical protein